MKRLVILGGGAIFGFLLSRARGTDYDTIVGMFRLEDMHIAGVMGVAIAVAALGLFLLRWGKVQPLTGPMTVAPKPMKPGVFLGGLTFGVGWGITGACPGTAVAQLGEGKLYALFTVGGLIVGTWLYALWQGSQTPTPECAEALQEPVQTG